MVTGAAQLEDRLSALLARDGRSPADGVAIVALDRLASQPFDPGMALVILGSRRVTMDFDLLVNASEAGNDALVKLLYRRHFELVTKFAPAGDVLRTVDNARVAAARVKMEQPRSLHFCDRHSGLLVDLLLDCPLPARDLASRATRITVEGGTVRVACREDLITLKEIATRDRTSARDAQDLEFLRRAPRKN